MTHLISCLLPFLPLSPPQCVTLSLSLPPTHLLHHSSHPSEYPHLPTPPVAPHLTELANADVTSICIWVIHTHDFIVHMKLGLSWNKQPTYSRSFIFSIVFCFILAIKYLTNTTPTNPSLRYTSPSLVFLSPTIHCYTLPFPHQHGYRDILSNLHPPPTLPSFLTTAMYSYNTFKPLPSSLSLTHSLTYFLSHR